MTMKQLSDAVTQNHYSGLGNSPVYVQVNGVDYPVVGFGVQNSEQAGVDWPKVWLNIDWTPPHP